MKNLRIIVLLLAVAASMGACKKNSSETDYPYIIFKNSAGQVISSSAPIKVAPNTTYRIYSEIAYLRTNGNNPDYDWKIDDGAFTQYSMYEGLDITTVGSFNGLGIQKATLDVSFSENDYGIVSGSTVIVRVKDQGSLSREVTFEIE